jgi:hypothetical protein
MRDLAPAMLTTEEYSRLHPAPPVTDSKLQRLRILAVNPNPKIRESVASSYHAPDDLFEQLAHDTDAGVRGWLARNESVPCDILRLLADDESETVRGWLALNFFVPADVMERLAEDESPTVRSLVEWKSQLATTA